jgi:hypothetical protein
MPMTRPWPMPPTSAWMPGYVRALIPTAVIVTHAPEQKLSERLDQSDVDSTARRWLHTCACSVAPHQREETVLEKLSTVTCAGLRR